MIARSVLTHPASILAGCSFQTEHDASGSIASAQTIPLTIHVDVEEVVYVEELSASMLQAMPSPRRSRNLSSNGSSVKL